MTVLVEYGDIRLPDRFWDKVYPEPNTGCWLWGGALAKRPDRPAGTGYGTFRWEGRTQYAHRVAYRELVGPIINEIDHWCDVTWCVRPDDLFDVTHLDNWARSSAITVAFAAVTECPAGHDYDEANTRWTKTTTGSGWGRTCRACDRDRRPR